jgi:hypothetical protein
MNKWREAVLYRKADDCIEVGRGLAGGHGNDLQLVTRDA